MGKKPFLLPSPFPQNRGGAPGRRQRSLPAAQGTAAAGAMGEREREARGVDSSPLDFREEGPQGGEPWPGFPKPSVTGPVPVWSGIKSVQI